MGSVKWVDDDGSVRTSQYVKKYVTVCSQKLGMQYSNFDALANSTGR